ncbi:MAG TPA: sulfotransferase family 2 domain-containing protein [Roseiarcus sp.]|nr:sulfotransferase family 2 domain-containing protein [Roseiarcus sp.]
MPFIHVNGKNILFLHIAKTGGTAVEDWMSGFGALQFHASIIPLFAKTTPQHYTFEELMYFFTENFFDYAFTVVRDPYARIESEFRMRALIAKKAFFKTHPTFSQWLGQALDTTKTDKWNLDNHLRPQVDFIGSRVKVFKYEHGLDNIIAQVAGDNGLPRPKASKIIYSGAKFTQPIVWDAQAILRVNTFFREDFALLGYPQREAPIAIQAAPTQP